MSPYPPPPWRLQGGLYASLWRMGAADPPLPPGVRPIRLGGEPLLATAFAVYEPGGMLAYNELLCGWVARRGLRAGLCIDRIWVDSAASLAGGRALWGIPKQMADFRIAGTAFAAASIAGASFTPVAGAPGRWPLRGWTLLAGDDGVMETRMSASGTPRLARTVWRFDAGGPLAFLQGRTPLFSAMLAPMRIRFG